MDANSFMKHVFTVILLLLVFTASQAKDLQEEYAVFGVGGKTCKVFNRAIKLGGKPYKQYEAWLFGYFSAYNQYTPNTYNILGAKRLDQILAWLNDYCKKHPQEFFVTASALLLANLHDSRRNLSPNREKQLPLKPR